MLLDDGKHDLFVSVVGFDDVLGLDITVSSVLVTALPALTKGSENHPSESVVPLTGLLGGAKDEEGGQRAGDRDPPPELSSEQRMFASGGPNVTRVLIDPSEICVDDVPSGPDGRTGGDLRNEITDGEGRREEEGDKAEDDETGV